MLADPTLAGGIGVIALGGLVGAIRHVLALAEGRSGEATVKQAFALLMTRWVLVLVAIYAVGVPLGRFGLAFVVLAYAAASAWSELQPERFANLIPGSPPVRSYPMTRRRTSGSTARPKSSRPARMSACGIPGQLTRMVAWVTPARC